MTITFVATSNKVAPTKVPEARHGASSTLEMAMRSNKAFTGAFASDSNSSNGGKPTSRPHGRPNMEDEKNIICIVQSSKVSTSSDSLVRNSPLGLVGTVTEAYNNHHSLVLRPDDFWQAVLTQFSFYVNSKAEALRNKFVDFEGKKQLVICDVGTISSVDHGTLANRMVDKQIIKNIKDPQVVDWLLPKFSTTTSNDRVAASVSIMSSLKAYFDYVFSLRCGIPQVTLEGTVEDWRVLRGKLDRLLDYDDPTDKLMTKWYALLAPVFDQLVLSAEGKPDLVFWDRVCDHQGGGSGPRYLSGWITVFACFDKDGKWQGTDGRQTRMVGAPRECQYPCIDTNDLPVGALSVPVLVDDNGVEYDTQMVAGQFAYEIVNDKDGRHDTIRSRTDWCIAYDVKKHNHSRQKSSQNKRNHDDKMAFT